MTFEELQERHSRGLVSDEGLASAAIKLHYGKDYKMPATGKKPPQQKTAPKPVKPKPDKK